MSKSAQDFLSEANSVVSVEVGRFLVQEKVEQE